MGFSDLIAQRHSIRNYFSTPVESEKLERILAAACRAPSAGNLQAYEIYKVTRVKDRSALSRLAHGQGFVLVAPVSLVFCANAARNEERFGERARFYALQDATIACTYAQLQAHELGLGTCWVGAFDPEPLRKLLKAPKPLEPVAILPIGYPQGEPELKGRRPLPDLLHTL